MLLRSCLAGAACLSVLAPTATAATTIRFNNGGPGAVSIVVTDNRKTDNGSIELVRGSEVIARSMDRDGLAASSGYLTVPNLIAGDVARAFGNGAVIASATYDGGPRIGADACAGSRAFSVTAVAGTQPVFVGAFLPGGDLVPGQRLRWTDAAVTARRPLAAGEIVRALTRHPEGDVEVVSRSSGVVAACAAPTDAEVKAATRRAIARTAAKLRTMERVRALPFAFPEAGSVCIELRDRAGVLIGIGTKRVRRAGSAEVRIRWTGRRMSSRVTLSASFAPERAGATAQQTRLARIHR